MAATHTLGSVNGVAMNPAMVSISTSVIYLYVFVAEYIILYNIKNINWQISKYNEMSMCAKDMKKYDSDIE